MNVHLFLDRSDKNTSELYVLILFWFILSAKLNLLASVCGIATMKGVILFVDENINANESYCFDTNSKFEKSRTMNRGWNTALADMKKSNKKKQSAAMAARPTNVDNGEKIIAGIKWIEHSTYPVTTTKKSIIFHMFLR